MHRGPAGQPEVGNLATRVGELLQEALAAKYTFLEFLGQGASSLVFRVRNLALGRFEALKVLFRESAEQEARFRREAHLVASLHHPHIATVYAFGEDAGFLWYSMQLIEGPSLAQLLRANGPLEPRLVLEIALPVLDALEYAHTYGIIHRDIKPANIMISPSFKPYLVDFGLARGLEGSELTQTGVGLGTPAYIAPEQAQGAKPDRRADIYSFAVTLYELLSGTRPFPGEDPLQVLLARLTEDPVPLLKVAPECPPELAAVVMKGMARDPAMRFASAAEMAFALQSALALDEPPVPPSQEVLALARPAPVELATARTQLLPRESGGAARRTAYRNVALSALGLLLAGGVIFLSQERRPGGPVQSDATIPQPSPVRGAGAVSVATPSPLPEPSPTATPTPALERFREAPPLKKLTPVRPPEALGPTAVRVGGELAATCVGVRVSLLVAIAKDGSLQWARLLQGGPEACNREALQAVRSIQWRPAENAEGEPVEAKAGVVIEFVPEGGT